MSRQSSRMTLETKPTPQPPSKNFLGCLIQPSTLISLPTILATKQLPEHASTAATTYTAQPGLQGHQLSQRPQVRLVSGRCP